MEFNPLDYRLAFERPERLNDTSAWHEHVPLAFALMQMLRPKVFVELGTHKGDSYLAFCQAVERLGIACSCYAVDTWRGDDHSGYYSDDVYDELRAYHDPRYGRFSSLIRSTFDEALAHFADGSIDLLHIDGLHTYEACLHDFESWLPKVSPRGVVLLHDTNVREKDFGVWRVWEENSRKYRGFAFEHGHGLGLLQVGPQAPEPFAAFLATCHASPAVADYFGRLGAAVAQERELGQIKERAANLQAELEAELANWKAHAANLEAELANLQAELANLRAHASNLEDGMHHYKAWVADLERHQSMLGERISELEVNARQPT